MSKKKVLTGPERKAALLDIGAKLASKNGAENVTRRMVATAGKVSEALVSNYFGTTADAQKAYKRQMKKLGLEEPSRERIAAIGVAARAHGPRDKRDARKRSAKEMDAINRKLNADLANDKRKAFVPAAKPLAPGRKLAARLSKKAAGVSAVKRAIELTGAKAISLKVGAAKKSAPAITPTSAPKRSAKSTDSSTPAESKPNAPSETKPTAPAKAPARKPASKPVAPAETKIGGMFASLTAKPAHAPKEPPTDPQVMPDNLVGSLP